jgi:hypothetical protein
VDRWRHGIWQDHAARTLAARNGLRSFPIDAFWYAHDALLKAPARTPDAQWLDTMPEEQAADFEATSRLRLRLAQQDVANLPQPPAILVEGPQVLPDLLPRGAAAVFLIPTPHFQRAVLAGPTMPPTSNPSQALENRIIKDQLYAARLAELAAAHGFEVIDIDGSRSPAEIVRVIERCFAGVLDKPREAVDLQPARRWENEVVADNIGRWLASPDAPPPDPPLMFPFCCECGRRGCSSLVDLTLDEFRSRPRVVARGHSTGE